MPDFNKLNIVIVQKKLFRHLFEFGNVSARLAALERLKMGVTCGLSVISSAQRSDDPVFGNNNARGYADVGI